MNAMQIYVGKDNKLFYYKCDNLENKKVQTQVGRPVRWKQDNSLLSVRNLNAHLYTELANITI